MGHKSKTHFYSYIQYLANFVYKICMYKFYSYMQDYIKCLHIINFNRDTSCLTCF